MASNQHWTFILCSVILFGEPLQAQCVSEGPRNAGTATNVSYPGSNFSFNNLSGTASSDDNRTTSFTLLSLLTGQTQFLQATNFGFSIPATAVICGITVNVEKSAGGIGLFTSVTDRYVYIVKNGGRTGVDHAGTGGWPGTDTYQSYGGATDDWGTSWLPSDINAGNFGIAIAANINGIFGLVPAARIDHIQVTVHYYVPTLLWSAVSNFEASVVDKRVKLNWTMGENAYYYVQRSADNIHWETISGELNQNSFIDAHPMPGQSHYRLRVMNADGAQSYSFSKSLLLPAGPSVQCYPNPFSGVLYIAGAGGQQVKLRDIYGRVFSLGKGPRHDLDHLPPGVYFISVGQWTKKIVKQ